MKRQLASGALTLAVVALPALACGAGLDLPVDGDEVHRLSLALDDPEGRLHGPVTVYYGASLSADMAVGAPTAGGEDPLVESVFGARLVTVALAFVLSGLLYAAVTIVRSRATALLACAALAASPAVADPRLRPEVMVAVFALLACLLLVGLPAQLRMRSRRRVVTQLAIVGSLILVVGLTTALAIGSQTDYGVLLLVPGLTALLATVAAIMWFVAMLKRRGVTLLPFYGFTRRLAPWIFASLAALGSAALMLNMFGGQTESVTLSGSGLLPKPVLLAIPIATLAAAGALLWLLRVGLAFGRHRRVDPDAVLLAFCAVLLMHRAQLPGRADALPAAAAFAILIAIGLRPLLVWSIGLSQSSRKPA